MSFTIKFIDARSLKRIKCEPLMLNFSDRADAEREAEIARLSKTFTLGKRVWARVEPARKP